MALCPCGSGIAFDDCCGPIIQGARAALTAEALMRSRYTAFVRRDWDHIDRTHARAMRGAAAANNADDSVEWVGLQIFGTTGGGAADETGTVDFAARFRKEGVLLVHRERSNFRREDGRWVYVDGDAAPALPPTQEGKVGRNQPCPCGSGKKYKKCCGG